jgi:TRAP-type uncharacterized transport system substrate-binding protein
MAINYDKEIKKLRKKFHEFDTVEEGLETLKQISTLQKKRFLKQGSVLPAHDGRVYYYDVELERFFEAVL